MRRTRIASYELNRVNSPDATGRDSRCHSDAIRSSTTSRLVFYRWDIAHGFEQVPITVGHRS